MKRFFVSNLIIAVLIVSAAFTSCKKDEDDEVGDMVKLLETIAWGDGYYYRFEYDSQNRIKKISNTGDVFVMLAYSGDDLAGIAKEGNTITIGNEKYDLNNDGFLAKWSYSSDKSSQEVSFQYQDGNMTKVMSESAEYDESWEYVTEYEYDDKKSPFLNCKTPKWFMFSLEFNEYLFSYGSKNNKTEISGDDGYTTLEYEYDSEGYPTKCTSKEFYDGEEVGGNVFEFTYK